MQPSCPIETQTDDMLHRMQSDTPPKREEVERLLVIAARHTAMRLDEGNRIMGEQTKCLGELRGSHVHMQAELKSLKEVVLEKHARELETLRGDLNAVRTELHESQSRLKYWAGGVCAVLVVLSNLNLGKLAELVR